MKRNPAQSQSIDEYITGLPREVQAKLEQVRTTVRKAAPGATEAMKYGLPTFVLGENLVHFGAFRQHIGFYPTPSGIERFRKELSAYASSKGSVQFPLDRPLPLALIRRIVKFRVKECLGKASAGK